MTESAGSVDRFSGLAAGYDRFRPSYPAACIRAILAGLPPRPLVADVGAGTGISTRALEAAGARAVALEPNEEMRAFARATGVDAREGSAENTGLAPRAVDAVTCFQAFHWFAHARAAAEFARILRPGGRLAIVWNEREFSEPFARGFRDLERRYADPRLLAGADFKDEHLEPLLRAAGFGIVRLQTFENRQRLDRAGAHGRMRSASYAPRSGPALERLTLELDALFERCAGEAGTVDFPYVTELWSAELESV